MNTDFIRLMANMLPIDIHIKKLESSIEDYSLAVTDEEKKRAIEKIAIVCTMFVYKHMDDGKEIEDIIKENEKISSVTSIIKNMNEKN